MTKGKVILAGVSVVELSEIDNTKESEELNKIISSIWEKVELKRIAKNSAEEGNPTAQNGV